MEQKGAYIQGIITGCIFCLQEDGPITERWGSYERRILYPRGLIIEAKGSLHPGAYDQKYFCLQEDGPITGGGGRGL